jgi:hypothetical protein
MLVLWKEGTVRRGWCRCSLERRGGNENNAVTILRKAKSLREFKSALEEISPSQTVLWRSLWHKEKQAVRNVVEGVVESKGTRCKPSLASLDGNQKLNEKVHRINSLCVIYHQSACCFFC